MRRLPIFWKTWLISGVTLFTVAISLALISVAIISHVLNSTSEQELTELQGDLATLLTQKPVDQEALTKLTYRAGPLRIYHNNELIFPTETNSKAITPSSDLKPTTLTVATSTGKYKVELFKSPESNLTSMVDNLYQVAIPLLPIGIITSALASWIYSAYFSRRLLQLHRSIAQMNNFSYRSTGDIRPDGDELDQLHTRIEIMYHRLENAHQKLKNENSRIRQLEDERTIFTQGATHELKTPLATISLLLEGLQQGLDGYRDIDEFTTKCSVELTRMNDIINEMLELGRIQDDKTTEQSHPLTELQHVLGDYMSLLEDKQLHVIWHRYDDPILSIPAKTLRKVLSNLLSNAIKYSPAGSAIEITLTSRQLRLVNNIHDPKGLDMNTLFQPFTSSTKTGSGIGLYFVATVLNKYHLSHSCKVTKKTNRFIFNIKFTT